MPNLKASSRAEFANCRRRYKALSIRRGMSMNSVKEASCTVKTVPSIQATTTCIAAVASDAVGGGVTHFIAQPAQASVMQELPALHAGAEDKLQVSKKQAGLLHGGAPVI